MMAVRRTWVLCWPLPHDERGLVHGRLVELFDFSTRVFQLRRGEEEMFAELCALGSGELGVWLEQQLLRFERQRAGRRAARIKPARRRGNR